MERHRRASGDAAPGTAVAADRAAMSRHGNFPEQNWISFHPVLVFSHRCFSLPSREVGGVGCLVVSAWINPTNIDALEPGHEAANRFSRISFFSPCPSGFGLAPRPTSKRTTQRESSTISAWWPQTAHPLTTPATSQHTATNHIGASQADKARHGDDDVIWELTLQHACPFLPSWGKYLNPQSSRSSESPRGDMVRPCASEYGREMTVGARPWMRRNVLRCGATEYRQLPAKGTLGYPSSQGSSPSVLPVVETFSM